MLSLQVLIVAAFLLVLGTALCFGGYKWFMILLPFLAFLEGFLIGANAAYGVYGKSILSIVVIIVAGLIVGLILAVLAYLFFNLAIILLGAFFGFTLGSGIVAYLGIDAGLIPIVVGLIIGGLVAFLVIRLNLPKYIIICLTALIGSEALIACALILAGILPLGGLKIGVLGPILYGSPWLIAVWLILAGAGAVLQLRKAKFYELDLQAGAKSAKG